MVKHTQTIGRQIADCIKSIYDKISYLHLLINPNLGGFFRDLFYSFLKLPRLKLVRIMLET